MIESTSSTKSPLLKVLVVDDEEIIHTVIGTFLTSRGHTAGKAMDGAAALLAVEKEAFDLIIADMRMPGLDGISLARTIRHRFPDLPMILITGHLDQEIKDHATTLGVSDVLIKPIRLRQLQAAMDKAVGGR
jgi:CheY-like chemotaxis protein